MKLMEQQMIFIIEKLEETTSEFLWLFDLFYYGIYVKWKVKRLYIY